MITSHSFFAHIMWKFPLICIAFGVSINDRLFGLGQINASIDSFLCLRMFLRCIDIGNKSHRTSIPILFPPLIKAHPFFGSSPYKLARGMLSQHLGTRRRTHRPASLRALKWTSLRVMLEGACDSSLEYVQHIVVEGYVIFLLPAIEWSICLHLLFGYQ